MIKYLLIDLDGTLLDFNAGERVAFIETINKFSKYELKESDIALFSEINERLFNSFARGEMQRIEFQEARFKEIFSVLNISADHSEANKFYLTTLKYRGDIYNDVLDTLKYLHNKYTLMIASNGMIGVQTQRLKNAGILDFFNKCYVSETIGINKPYIEFFNYIFNDLDDYDSEHYAIIGDRLETDVLGGINANMKTILVNRNNLTINDIKPDYIVESFDKIIDIL